jgi:hypothetical protein
MIRVWSIAVLALVAAIGALAAPSAGDPLPPPAVLRQIERLAPQRPGVVDVYAIVIGGDGGEDVFQREVMTVAERLQENLDVDGHLVTMINNRRMPEPEATLRSIRYAIQRVSQRMDKDEDLLFIHITSHGSANHFLVLAHPRQDLAWLGPKAFAAMLKESGIRHRFIVISGCYSGGFVPDLANETTVVVTAAAATVMSYGCGNDSQITDFSRAFYNQVLHRSRSLADAARAVAQVVHEDESRQGRKHSYPQSSIGYQMDEYLRAVTLTRKATRP